ncbi:MAG: hypothetical protein Ta2D_05460 [Rickettsiales bacterium]|nr:MAG: hypothetical protein Ta2D_05460 [Rickettsiales bacterium]
MKNINLEEKIIKDNEKEIKKYKESIKNDSNINAEKKAIINRLLNIKRV